MVARYVTYCVAEREKKNPIRGDSVHMDIHADLWHCQCFPLNRYHQRNVCTVGSLQQLRTGEDNGVFPTVQFIPSTANVDDLSLLKTRLRITH